MTTKKAVDIRQTLGAHRLGTFVTVLRLKPVSYFSSVLLLWRRQGIIKSCLCCYFKLSRPTLGCTSTTRKGRSGPLILLPNVTDVSEIPLAVRRYSPVALIKISDDIARCYGTECQAV